MIYDLMQIKYLRAHLSRHLVYDPIEGLRAYQAENQNLPAVHVIFNPKSTKLAA